MADLAPVAAIAPADRQALDQVVALAGDGLTGGLPGCAAEVYETWQARTDALTGYRSQLPADADTDAVLESLLHMHHNRAIGVDRDREASCRRLARHAALGWTARHAGDR